MNDTVGPIVSLSSNGKNIQEWRNRRICRPKNGNRRSAEWAYHSIHRGRGDKRRAAWEADCAMPCQ